MLVYRSTQNQENLLACINGGFLGCNKTKYCIIQWIQKGMVDQRDNLHNKKWYLPSNSILDRLSSSGLRALSCFILMIVQDFPFIYSHYFPFSFSLSLSPFIFILTMFILTIRREMIFSSLSFEISSLVLHASLLFDHYLIYVALNKVPKEIHRGKLKVGH